MKDITGNIGEYICMTFIAGSGMIKKLKDSDVAKATGITKSTFSTGRLAGASRSKISFKIADFFGVTLDYLMNGTYDNQINTIAAHHDEAEWTEEELEEIEEFKRYVLSKRKK